jgi:polyhydroxyalkanoate synthesis regulator phasin
MEDLFKKVFYAGVGLTAIAAERIEKVVKDLMEKGSITELDGKKILDDFFKATEHKKEEFEEKMKKATEEVVNKFSRHSASSSDVDHLVARIEAIEAKLGITHNASLVVEVTPSEPETAL